MTKKTRDLAIKICQMHASNLYRGPDYALPGKLTCSYQIWDAMGVQSSDIATVIAWLAACEVNNARGSDGRLTNEFFAEAESMLRTGWEPDPKDLEDFYAP